MADVKNMITDGIGASPGSVHFFLLMGLDVNPSTTVPLALTASSRSLAMTAEARSVSLTVATRGRALTAEDRP